MSKVSKAKPSAADRTVDMFSVPHAVVEIPVETSDAPEVATNKAETIEQSAERWRANAFFTQEHLSKHWGNTEGQSGKYRLSKSTRLPGWILVERMGLKDGDVYSWTGIMFPASELNEITGVFVTAAKQVAAKEAASVNKPSVQ